MDKAEIDDDDDDDDDDADGAVADDAGVLHEQTAINDFFFSFLGGINKNTPIGKLVMNARSRGSGASTGNAGRFCSQRHAPDHGF